MSGRKPKHDNRVLRYLTKNGPTTQAVIAKGLKMNLANIYPIVKRMVEQGKVRMDGKFVTGTEVKQVKQQEPVQVQAQAGAVNPIIKMFEDEIADIDAGIRSLKITRSYMVRRIEYIRAND